MKGDTPPQRFCVMCKHFEYESISEWQTECSSGMEGGYTCQKSHFVDDRPYDRDSVREIMLRAVKCPDYDDSEAA